MSDDLRADCLLAAECLAETNTFETGQAILKEAADRIEELEKSCNEWADVSQSNYQRAKAAEAKLALALVGLEECRDEIDRYIWQEYPGDHPVYERCRNRDYDANPARIAIAKIKVEQK